MRYFRHETLLTLARKAQAAAGDGDAARADELLALLAIQAEDERLAWHGAVDWAVAGEKVT